MEWLLLEALVALALAVFIVWFTMGGKRKDPPRDPNGSERRRRRRSRSLKMRCNVGGARENRSARSDESEKTDTNAECAAPKA